jgi:hypothetical protein
MKLINTNKCDACSGIVNYFDQDGLDPFEVKDRCYYQGKGAPAQGITFQWFKAFSDGSAQQFMNTTFLFCVSMFSILFGVCVVWNYFALVMVNASVTLKEVY